MLKTFVAATTNPATLTERVLNASFWNIVSMAVMYPLRLAGNLIMTRILAPEAFGLMAAVITLQIGLQMFSDIGILQSVMRDPRGDDPKYLRVAWVMQIMRSFVIIGVIFLIGLGVMLLGPIIAGPDTVYADEHLPWLIWLSALMALCSGFESTCNLLAQRRMALKPGTIMEVCAQFVALTVMVTLGVLTESVWALIAGAISTNVTRLILTHTIIPGPRMGFEWDRKQVAEMWSFGKWLILSSFGGFLTNYGDRMIFSALFDKRAFGVFAIAIMWVELATSLIFRIGSATLVPSLSESMNKGGNVRNVLKKFNNVFHVFAIVLFVGAVGSSYFIFKFLYTDQYQAGIFFMQLLSAKILLYAFMPVQQYLVASGRSRYFAGAVLSNGLMIVGLCYAGFFVFGVEGAIIGSIVGGLISPLFCSLHGEIRAKVSTVRQIAMVVLVPLACLAVWLVVPGLQP